MVTKHYSILFFLFLFGCQVDSVFMSVPIYEDHETRRPPTEKNQEKTGDCNIEIPTNGDNPTAECERHDNLKERQNTQI